MAFSDLCKISNAFKAVENEQDQSERIMEENSMVRDLITKILDETGPSEPSTKPCEKPPNITLNAYAKENTFMPPPTFNTFQDYNFLNQNDQNGFTFNMQNGFNQNGFNYPENDVTSLLGIESDAQNEVTPEQLNLLRLAAQEIGGAQFTSPNKFDDKYYNFFEPNRGTLPESNAYQPNFNRPTSLNLDMNFNANMLDYPNTNQMASNFNKFENEPNLMNFINLNLNERRDDVMQNITEFKVPEVNGHFQNDDHFKQENQKMFYNRNFQMPVNKNEGFYNGDNGYNMNQSFDYQMNPNFKPNGFHNNEFMQRPMAREFQNGPMNERANFENPVMRENMQQAALMRQNQDMARQMGMMARTRPPPNQLNVDVSFLPDNAPFNIGLGALLGPSPPVPPPVLPSPMLDLPLLAPFYAMRNIRTAHTSSAILHARLDACYEQWRQLERERKRTEARLALAYPGRAVSSSNSIPVPRLPPCPARVDRLTVDMLREHTKVLTLMGKMETLRASVCVAQNKKAKPDDPKITVLKRGQENVADKTKTGIDPATFDPKSWRDDVKHWAEIAPHSEVESAMLAWRGAVGAVQAARRRELAPHHDRYVADPIVQLAEAVKQLSICARRARCAMWCDLTLTVALASQSSEKPPQNQNASPKQSVESTNATQTANKTANVDTKEEKPTPPSTKQDADANTRTNKQPDKQTDKPKRNNYRKVNQGRNDFYPKNQRYDHRFMHNRHPYHYLATGPINWGTLYMRYPFFPYIGR